MELAHVYWERQDVFMITQSHYEQIHVSQPKIDCHVHLFDPVRFPYAPDTFYRPSGHEVATANALGHVMKAHGVQHALIVGPNSGYGFDNSCMLDALAQGAGKFKGLAVVRNDIGRTELQDLQAQGVIGVTLNAALLGTQAYADAEPLLRHLHDLELWAAVQVQHDQLVALRPLLEHAGVRVMIDHCGRPNPASGLDQQGFQALLQMADSGRTVVKLSSLLKSSERPFPHEDAWVYVRALVDAYTPESLVWGSDWPFLRAVERVDYGPLLELFAFLVPDKEARHAILWETPRRCFGF
jgi:predicted TIM-barrel fold metal-dependent hydrolase